MWESRDLVPNVWRGWSPFHGRTKDGAKSCLGEVFPRELFVVGFSVIR
jgi:hypothetical protein